MKRNIISLIAFLLLPAVAYGAKPVSGVVMDDKGELLIGANVYWAGTGTGVATDIDGAFSLPTVSSTNLLVTSYMGYHNDTTRVHGGEQLTIVLVSDLVLDEVTITERKMAVLRSRTAAFDTQTLTGDELCKAACCNLSESFETSASVDVAYADAATGAKQIRLLGLSGTYVQLLTENTPNVRGLAQSFGMEYIPGAWMEAIQVSKGTSSVINGYEAIAGQINVEFLKPQKQDPIAVNLYLNTELMAEINATGGWDINDKVSTGILLNAKDMELEMDHNHDGFTDLPRNRNLNLLNRWYIKSGDYTGQVLVRALYDQRLGGTLSSLEHGAKSQEQGAKSQEQGQFTAYPIDLRTRRIDGFVKNGYVFDQETGMSVGVIASASYHSQTNRYGSRLWDANQTNAYLNAIFQTSFEDPELDPFDFHEHKLSAGISVNYDRYDEQYEGIFAASQEQGTKNQDFLSNEVTSGMFAEYTYSYKDKVTLLVGLREDYSNRYGFFTTPRMNLRYAPFEWWTLRGSVGLGYRSPNAIADNAAYLPSNRVYTMEKSLKQERSFNTGITTTFYIPIGKRELTLSAEYYYTRFLDGVIADIDHDLHDVRLFNISDVAGAKSYSHNYQVEANMEILRGWTMTAAFRYTDVKQSTFLPTGELVLMDKALQNQFKAVLTTSYQTPLKTWQFDLTAQFNGPGRMPMGFTAPEGSKQYYTKTITSLSPSVGGVGGGPESLVYHKWYPQLLGQITKYWRTCSLYLGAENMTNFTQDSPIRGDRYENSTHVNPNSPDFDASMVWAPISGWKIYLGFRWNLERE
ncbi:MAG: TonB-dependent receptor domain-containing protein [Paludibacteraceae bacterium]